MAFRLQSQDTACAWSKDLTQEYLTANPLPQGFKWPHRDHRDEADGGLRDVQPSHKQVTGYGKWLRETPYFPGLFEAAHQILADAEDLGDAEWLAAELNARRPQRQALGVDFARRLREAREQSGTSAPLPPRHAAGTSALEQLGPGEDSPF